MRRLVGPRNAVLSVFLACYATALSSFPAHTQPLLHNNLAGFQAPVLMLIAVTLSCLAAATYASPHHPITAHHAPTNTPLTVVSAYYAGSAKHTPTKYATWGRQFMRMQAPVVFFTDSPSAVPALDTRPVASTHVVVKPVDDFYVMRLIRDWDAQLALDLEGDIHSAHLFKIWLEKPSFVRHAIAANAFGSTHFVWVDYGCFRGDGTAAPWSPSPAFLPPHKMLLLNVSALHPFKDKQVGGTIFGGDVAAWRVWTSIFYDVLMQQHSDGAFVGDD